MYVRLNYVEYDWPCIYKLAHGSKQLDNLRYHTF